MEAWHKEYIKDNLSDLICNIKCNALLICYLSKQNVLANADIEILNAKGNHVGDQEKSRYLLDVLVTRKGAYKHLVKALHSCKQTGALEVLLKGIHTHVLSNNVLFQGKLLPLQDVCRPFGGKFLEKIVQGQLNVTNYEPFLSEEPMTLAVNTIPDALPYYVPRILSIDTQLHRQIFEKLEKDIFCIEGIELYQLSKLSNIKRNNTSDRSRNQIHRVTARYILLEHHEHFQEIVNKTSKSVHWIKHDNDEFFYIKCSTASGIQRMKEFLNSTNSKHISEEEFLLRFQKSPRNSPILLYDTPGMGKSILLARIARESKTSQPNYSVLYVEIPELISKLKPFGQEYTSVAIKQALVENMTTSRFSRNIMNTLFDKTDHQIQLFLDAFDEVSTNDLALAHSIIDCIAKECTNIRMFVTTRPHRRSELESKFGVLGYNILPFNDSNKLSFFLKYWQSEHGVAITDEIKQYAEYCIKTVFLELSSDEGDIAGIPLQCKMLAEICVKEAKRGGLIPTELQFQLNSIFKVYRRYIDTKFSTFCTNKERQMCYDFHVRESLRTLFKESSLSHEESRVLEDELIYRIGILVPLKSDSSIPAFQHRTLAEFFAAEYFATSATSTSSKLSNEKKFIHLFFQRALTWSTVKRETKFQHPVVCLFLDFFLSTMYLPGQDFGPLKDALRESENYNSNTLIHLLECSLRINAENLFCYLLDIYLGLNKSTNTANGLLIFKPKLRDTKNHRVKETNKLISNLKDDAKFKKLVAIAAIYVFISEFNETVM